MDRTNRELLELAAKAAGYEFVNYHEARDWTGGWAAVRKPESQLAICRWNPLTDDGDALRLAVKLEMAVSAPYCYSATAKCCDVRLRVTEEEVGGDPYAATRIAIVRAAAEVGSTAPVVLQPSPLEQKPNEQKPLDPSVLLETLQRDEFNERDVL